MIVMTDNHNQNKKSDEKQLLQHNTTRMLTIVVTDVVSRFCHYQWSRICKAITDDSRKHCNSYEE